MSGEELQEYLEELELNLKFCEEDLTDQQKEKEKLKSDGWKPYLVKYVTDRVESEAPREQNPTWY